MVRLKRRVGVNRDGGHDERALGVGGKNLLMFRFWAGPVSAKREVQPHFWRGEIRHGFLWQPAGLTERLDFWSAANEPVCLGRKPRRPTHPRRSPPGAAARARLQTPLIIRDFKDRVYPFFESDTLPCSSTVFVVLFLVVYRFLESSR